MKLSINTAVFAAVASFRAVKDVRYYLQGVYLETGSEGARLCATDGHQMAVARVSTESLPECSVIIPDSVVSTIKAGRNAPELIEVECADGHNESEKPRTVTAQYGSVIAAGKETDAKFPEWQRVVPEKASGEVADYDPELLIRISKACKTLGQKHFCGIKHNGTSAGLSVLNDDFLVVTMGLRTDPLDTSPSWTRHAINQPNELKEAA